MLWTKIANISISFHLKEVVQDTQPYKDSEYEYIEYKVIKQRRQI
jgi:hypothetical protein